jgi:hypothetical protein
MKSKAIDHQSGGRKMRKRLERSKRTKKGREVRDIEMNLSNASLHDAKSVSDLEQRYNQFKKAKKSLRDFYYSQARLKDTRHYKLQKRKVLDQLCSEERSYVTGRSKKKPVLFVGDRGYGVGSRIKSFLKYGGIWKPKTHSLYTTVCVTNENNTSQTCPFCYKKLVHPIKITKEGTKKSLKSVNGTFVCNNPKCISVKADQSHHSRGQVSALSIGLSGLGSLFFSETFPEFSTKISQSHTGFNQKAITFLKRSMDRLTTGGGHTSL